MSFQRSESERIKALVGLFAEYASKVPSDKVDWKPESSAKSAKELLEHMIASNQGFAAIIAGKNLDIKIEKSERGDVKVEQESLEAAIEAFRESGQVLAHSVASLEDSNLAEKRAMPWGEEWEMPRLLATASGHISYHWGQLAYLQTIWGDTNDYM